jgi:hypothetical protein
VAATAAAVVGTVAAVAAGTVAAAAAVAAAGAAAAAAAAVAGNRDFATNLGAAWPRRLQATGFRLQDL